MNENKNIVIYQSGEIELKVSVDKKTIWLKNTEDIATLFDVQRPAIVKHIGTIYKTKELSKNSTGSILEQVLKIWVKNGLPFLRWMQARLLLLIQFRKYYEK